MPNFIEIEKNFVDMRTYGQTFETGFLGGLFRRVDLINVTSKMTCRRMCGLAYGGSCNYRKTPAEFIRNFHRKLTDISLMEKQFLVALSTRS